ncbi:MAG: RNA 2'-phosphotransferase [Ruminococcus sp.]
MGNEVCRLDYKKIGRFISLILRHHPEAIGISLDHHGWANVGELITGINNTGKYHIDMPMLEEIVIHDNKQRYSFNPDKTKIRANQGHSINVDVELQEAIPPEILYHGTGEKYVRSICAEGLQPKSRLYVHLSKDIGSAVNVGTRHGKPVVFTVASGEMYRKGYRFYLSVNGVWLTKSVPVEFIQIEVKEKQ